MTAVKVLLALLIMTPLALLVVGTIRGRVQVRSCCAVPTEQDGRLSWPLAVPARRDATHDAQSDAANRSAH